MATENMNQWAMGTFEMNGVMIPIALLLANFAEAKAQFEIDIEEMEDELYKFREKYPTNTKRAKGTEALIKRMCKVVDTYEMMLAYHRDQIKQLQRLNAEMKQPFKDVFIDQHNGGYHSIKSILRGQSGR